MCDMQKMPTREDASCEEDSEMNFTAFSAVGGAGTHFVTTGGQLPVSKLQQNVANNGTSLSQVVGMVGGLPEGMQYVRALDGGATLQSTPQLISIPIQLPGAKPGDPQPTVQIQVLGPNLTLQAQQQPKYQMQIPIQGFQQGGAVLALAYSQDGNETGGIQLLGNTLPEGLQVLAALPQEMQMVQPSQMQEKEQMQQNVQHQVYVTPNHQIVISGPENSKNLNNNTSGENNNTVDVVIKEECEEHTNDDKSSQDTETSEGVSWQVGNPSQDLVKYLNTLPPQYISGFSASARTAAFSTTVPTIEPLGEKEQWEIEVRPLDEDMKPVLVETNVDEDEVLKIKKKKKYKKKPSKPARPKPGQVVITTASDGTPIYCCPECQMGYPVKEQLEMHLVVHKIERRFICGICGAGLKRKEHLERHKMGHNPERPYVCGVCRKGFKRREHLNLHTVIHSGVKTELCGECGKGFYRKDHLRKHARSHESKRARDEAHSEPQEVKPVLNNNVSSNTLLPEITIHVPTSANMQVPVQINIPQHVVTSLAAAQQAQQSQHAQSDAHSQLDALLAEHS